MITAKRHPDTNIDDYTDNNIPNTANLDFINESGVEDEIKTEPVTVTPPPTPVDPPTTPEDPPVTPEDPSTTPEDPPVTPVDPPTTPEDPPVTPVDPPTTPEDPPVTSVNSPTASEEPSAQPDDPGNKLPETATKIFSLLLIGFVMIMIGLTVFKARKKRV